MIQKIKEELSRLETTKINTLSSTKKERRKVTSSHSTLRWNGWNEKKKDGKFERLISGINGTSFFCCFCGIKYVKILGVLGEAPRERVGIQHHRGHGGNLFVIELIIFFCWCLLFFVVQFEITSFFVFMIAGVPAVTGAASSVTGGSYWRLD